MCDFQMADYIFVCLKSSWTHSPYSASRNEITNPEQGSEPQFVVQRAAILSRELPGQVQAIKVVSSQESQGRLDECTAPLWSEYHGHKPAMRYQRDNKATALTPAVLCLTQGLIWPFFLMYCILCGSANLIQEMNVLNLRTDSIDQASNREKSFQVGIAKKSTTNKLLLYDVYSNRPTYFTVVVWWWWGWKFGVLINNAIETRKALEEWGLPPRQYGSLAHYKFQMVLWITTKI